VLAPRIHHDAAAHRPSAHCAGSARRRRYRPIRSEPISRRQRGNAWVLRNECSRWRIQHAQVHCDAHRRDQLILEFTWIRSTRSRNRACKVWRHASCRRFLRRAGYKQCSILQRQRICSVSFSSREFDWKHGVVPCCNWNHAVRWYRQPSWGMGWHFMERRGVWCDSCFQ